MPDLALSSLAALPSLTTTDENDLTASIHLLRHLIMAEAMECEDDGITPDHLLMGICRFPDAHPPEPHPLRAIELKAARMAVERAFADAGLNRLRIRAAVLQVVPRPGREPVEFLDDEPVYSRTPATRALFDIAESHCAELVGHRTAGQSLPLTPLHLLFALLQSPEGVWAHTLTGYEPSRDCLAALRQSVAALLNISQPTVARNA